MKKKSIWLLTFMLVLSMFLAACSGGKKEEAGNDPKPGDNGNGDPKEETPTGPQEGGTITFVMNSEFKGLLDINFYDSESDADILQFSAEGLIGYDENLSPEPHLATWETEDNKTFKFKFKEGVKWHNGEELTTEDYVFALETIATLGADHNRWSNVNVIEGAQEFHEGKADSISGVNVINDYEIEITMKTAAINNLENLWTYAMPKKHFEGLAPEDMLESDQVRLNPIGTGPFKITKVVPGESVELERFDDYWQGKPYLDKVIVKVVDTSQVVGELNNGNIDLTPIVASSYPDYLALGDKINIEIVQDLSYYYIGFKFGELKDGKIVMNKDKYADKNLRKAMMYAIDREAWVDSFFNGLASPIDSVIPSAHWIAAKPEELDNNYTYDPEKAKQILEDAGWVDKDGDGFRETPDGEPFKINFAHYATTNPTFEIRATQFVQWWNEIGLNAGEQATMIEANTYYDMIQNDDPAMEVFFGGWSVGADPDTWGLWGDDTILNYPRWINDRGLELQKQAVDLELVGDDPDARRALYVEFQQLVNEELPMLPIMETQAAFALSPRLQGVTFEVGGPVDPHLWYVAE